MARESRSLVVAHKRWHCSVCRDNISPGETYARWVALPGHDAVPAWWKLRLCARCELDRGRDVPYTEPWPPAIQRPDGRWYQPRSIRVLEWEEVWVDDDRCGAVVLGTHDVERARPLAEQHVRRIFDDALRPIKPQIGWWRLALNLTCYGRDEYEWTPDPVRGAAGVWWSADYAEAGEQADRAEDGQ